MKYPRTFWYPIGRVALMASVPFAPLLLTAQEDADSEAEIFDLSPFTVEGSEDVGYYSSQTMAGGRLRTELKDVATSVQVVTEQFIEDVGATSIDEILAYTTGTEAAGSMSDYLQVAGEGGDLNQSEARQNPDAALRVRGLARPTRTTNYFESAIPFNSYVSSRIDINRGANSFLFGLGAPGGIVNTSLQGAVLANDSLKVSHRVSTENFESNYSQQLSINMNKVLIEDKLAVRFAAFEAENEFMQKPAYKDEARRYFALKFKPLAEHNINISANYEIGHTNAVPVDRLGPLETLSTFVDNPYGTVWGGTLDGEVTNAAGRRINDPFNNWRAGQSSTWLGLDVNGDEIPLAYYQNQHLHRTGWMAVFDGSTGRTDGLADYGVDTGWLNTVAELNNPYFNPTNHNYSRNENVLVRNLHMGNIDTGLFPEYEGYRAQGLLDYEVFDFRRNLYSGSIDNSSTEFDRKMAFIDATTKDGNFGIEIAYNRENSSRNSFVVNGAPSIDIDVNYTNPAGPAQDPNDNTSFGVPNPNFGRLYFFAEASSNTRNADQREAMRATAFAKFDFAEKFGESNLLSKLGRHNLSILLDESSVDTQRFNQKPMTFGNDAHFHLATDATIFQRNAAAIFYISDPYLEAFENPNFKMSDFYTTGAAPETILDYPSDYEIPLTYISRGDPETGVKSGALQTTKQGYYTPQFLDLGGVLTRTEVSSQAANLQSYYLGGHLVANLGYREDQVTQIRNNEPPRYGTDEGDVPGPVELDNVAILTPDVFTLENGETEIAPKTSTFGYGLVLKAPSKWLPDWLGLSAHYGESSNFSPNVGKFDFWGNSVPGASGETKDYGVTINLAGNTLVARINRYESAMVNGSFNDVNANAGSFVNQQGRFYGRYWSELMEYDRDLDGQFDDPTFDDGINPATGEPQGVAGDGIVDSNNLANGNEYLTLQQYHDIWNAYDNFWSDFVKETEDWKLSPGDADAGVDPSFTRNVVVRGLLADTADLQAEGTELTLTWNPSKQLRLSVSASQQEVTRSNVAPRFERMLEEFVLAMSAVENGTRFRGNGNNAMTMSLRDPFAGGTSIRTPLASGAQGQALFKAKALEGSTSPELAEHSFRVLGNYSFRDGFLKGVKMGGAHRWRDPTAIGYGRTTMTYLPGQIDLEMSVVDVDRPFYNDEKGSTDIWFGYNRKIFGDRAKWNIQLNIRNVFADSDPIVVQRQPDGTPNRVAIPAARQFVLSNSITF